MENMTYKLTDFEGPLDLLLALIEKNKMNILDISISLICDQYLAFLAEAKAMDMEITTEFLNMASQLMVWKSEMLLPHEEEGEKPPRFDLSDILIRHQHSKEAAPKMHPLYAYFSNRFVKDTDEISPDRSFVADQEVESLLAAVRRINAYRDSIERVKRQFKPITSKPIVPVEVKIVGILHHIDKKKNPSMKELLSDAVSLPDLIAIFLGILELIKVRKILIEEDPDSYTVIHGSSTRFVVNDEPPAEDGSEEKKPRVYDDSEPIPLSSKAEMHREQRRIIREQKLAEKKRLREEERARRAEERRRAKGAALTEDNLSINDTELPPDDSDLEEEARMAELLDNRLSEDDEDLLDDIGLDMNEIVRTMTEKAKEFVNGETTERSHDE